MPDPPLDARLLRVRDLLFFEWDPIGVNGYPQCRDEYDLYAPGICRLLDEGAGEDRLTAHLLHLAREVIGLSGLPEAHHRTISRRLLEP